MIISQQEHDYKPITITLTEKKEADLLWQILNCATAISFNDYVESNDLDSIALKNQKFVLFCEFDKIHHLNGFD